MLKYTLALLQNVRSDRKGVTALEYGLLAGLIAIALITGAGLLGTGLNTMFSSIATTL